VRKVVAYCVLFLRISSLTAFPGLAWCVDSFDSSLHMTDIVTWVVCGNDLILPFVQLFFPVGVGSCRVVILFVVILLSLTSSEPEVACTVGARCQLQTPSQWGPKVVNFTATHRWIDSFELAKQINNYERNTTRAHRASSLIE
jgi:hypothetical protein